MLIEYCYESEYVGVMKAVIYNINNDTRIVDLRPVSLLSASSRP